MKKCGPRILCKLSSPQMSTISITTTTTTTTTTLILFNIYLSPLLDIFDKYPDINFHVYADDIQIYCNLPDPSLNISTLNKCLEEIRYWLAANSLALNSEKTTAILINTSHTLPYIGESGAG